MKIVWTPTVVLVVLVICLEAYVNLSASQLPDRVASHFGFSGQADDWMSRSEWTLVMSIAGAAVPALFVLIAMVLPFTPARFVNIRDRDYWLAAERRRETFAYMSDTVLWIGCAMVAFFAWMQYLTIEANKVSPAQLPMGLLSAGAIGLIVVSIALVIRVMRRFARPV